MTFKLVGRLLFTIAIAGLGYVYREDDEKRDTFVGNLDLQLKKYEMVVEEKYLIKAYRVLTMLIITTALCNLP